MGKQTRSKKAENLGKGKVTPLQVAFIVDRYLSDNNFTQSRSTFRTEASFFISKTNVKEAPKSLLSLDAILDEYICLKEQKVFLEQQKVQVEQEKSRVETLFKGMQCAMQAYNNSTTTISTPPLGSDLLPKPNPNFVTPTSGNTTNVTPTTKSVPWLQNTTTGHTNFSTPCTNLPSQNKRKGSKPVSDAPTSTKRQCSQVTRKTYSSAGITLPFLAHNINSTRGMPKQTVSSIQTSSRTSSAVSSLAAEPRVLESSVVKNLFKQSSPPLQSSSPSPKTPPQECTSQVDNPASPLDNSSLVNTTCISTPQDITSNCAVISSTKTVTVSPSKHLGCYQVERSHYISSSSPAKSHLKRLGAREHVKGRLDFGSSDMPVSSDQTATDDIPTSGSDENVFDMDMSNFDLFNPDFFLSDLLDIDLDCGDAMDPANDILPGSTHESGIGNLDANYSYSELLSTVAETLSERDMNIQGQDSPALVKTITKCITITSPAKKRRSSAMDQENLVAIN